MESWIQVHQKELIRWGGTILSYLLCLFLGGALLQKIMYELNYSKNPFYFVELLTGEDTERKTYSLSQSSFLGIIERFFYLLALQSQLVILFPAWLALKITIQWGRWKDDKNGRVIFNNFLIGNIINIILSLTSYFSIVSINSYQITDPLIESIILFLAILLLPFGLIYFSFFRLFSRKKTMITKTFH